MGESSHSPDDGDADAGDCPEADCADTGPMDASPEHAAADRPDTAPTANEHVDALERLAEAVDAVLGLDWGAASGTAVGEAAVQVVSLKARLVAAESAAVAALEADPFWQDEGFRTAASKLAYEVNESSASAKRRVKDARKLRHLPLLAEELAAGTVTEDAARLILRADRADTHDKLVDDEELLVGLAATTEYTVFAKAVAYWCQLAAPDAADKDAAAAEKNRSVHLSETLDNRGRLDGWLTPQANAEVGAELHRLEQELFESDWAEARERLGDRASKTDLRRTAPQRHHDALQEMARRSASNTAEGAAPRARTVVSLHMDYQTFVAELARHTGTDGVAYPQDRLCEFDDGTVIVPSVALGLALGGEIRRIVFGGDGEILDFGRRRRLFTTALAEAIGARDGECFALGCHLPPARCQTDHVTEWHELGTTSAGNGQPGCRFHNLWKHVDPLAERRQRARHQKRFGRPQGRRQGRRRLPRPPRE